MPFKEKQKDSDWRKTRYATDPIYRSKVIARNLRWLQTHRENARNATRRWQENHPDAYLKTSKRYQITHADAIKEQQKKWRKENREKLSIKNARRRATQSNSPINDLTLKQWELIKSHYKKTCVYCGKKPKQLTKDHIIPLSIGGEHTFTNIVPACSSCNSKKGVGKVLIPIQPLLLTY